jgi:hypothetical protein
MEGREHKFMSMCVSVDEAEPLLRFASVFDCCCEVVEKLVAGSDALGVPLLGDFWEFLDFH